MNVSTLIVDGILIASIAKTMIQTVGGGMLNTVSSIVSLIEPKNNGKIASLSFSGYFKDMFRGFVKTIKFTFELRLIVL